MVFGAVDELSSAAPRDGARVARAPIDAHGVCGCSGVQLRQLGLSDAEREGMEGELLRRANPNPDPNPSLNPGPNLDPTPTPNPNPSPNPNPNQARFLKIEEQRVTEEQREAARTGRLVRQLSSEP